MTSIFFIATSVVLIVAARLANGLDSDVSLVFTKEEVKRCTRIRTPSTLYNEDTGSIHVVARCCGINQCSGKGSTIHRRRLDNDEDATVIMKTSTDGGATWGKFQTLSPKGQNHYANGAGIYDRHRKRLVVQYNYIFLLI